MSDLEHGRSRWLAGCRCDECHAGLVADAKLRRAVAAVHAGRAPEIRVAPAKARRQLARLRARGLSIRAIAEATGVSVGALQHLWQRDRRHVALTTEQRLLGYRP